MCLRAWILESGFETWLATLKNLTLESFIQFLSMKKGKINKFHRAVWLNGIIPLKQYWHTLNSLYMLAITIFWFRVERLL